MNYFIPASTADSALTTKHMKEMTETLDKNNLLMAEKLANPPRFKQEFNVSPQNSKHAHLELPDIIDRIRQDRNKLLVQSMRPKHLYLGHKQHRDLQMSGMFGMENMIQDDNTPPMFLGFEVYRVHQDEHYVMTGE